MMDRYLKVIELAKMLNMSPKTVRAMVSRGDLPNHAIGRQVRFRERDIEAWLATRRRPAVGERGLVSLAAGRR